MELALAGFLYKGVEHGRQDVEPDVGHHEPILFCLGETHFDVVCVKCGVARQQKHCVDAPQQEEHLKEELGKTSRLGMDAKPSGNHHEDVDTTLAHTGEEHSRHRRRR